MLDNNALISALQAAPTLQDLLREQARRSLYEFLKQAWNVIDPGTPYEDNWHIKAICDYFQGLLEDKLPTHNLVCNVPPGSGKSTIVGVCLTPWMWLHKPAWSALFLSGSESICLRDSMKMRNLIESDWYQAFKPGWKFAADQNSKQWVKNTAGGGRQAMTIGSRITGQRVMDIFIDDPNDAKDISDTKLDAVSDAYFISISNRLADMRTGHRGMIQQRVHERDLTGEILRRDPKAWTHLVIRQCYETNDPDKCEYDPRLYEGELMFPSRFTTDVVESERRTLLDVGFEGQHQQRPIPRKGGLFDVDKIQIIDVAPVCASMCRGWDVGATLGAGDPTVGVKLGVTKDGEVIILDVVREQTDHPRRLVKRTAEMDGTTSCFISYPQDPGQAGKDQVRSMISDFAGYMIRFSPESGPKTTRAEPYISQVNGGNVKMLRGDWNAAYISELRTFPRGVHDDQVDASSRAYSQVLLINDPWLNAMEDKINKEKLEELNGV